MTDAPAPLPPPIDARPHPEYGDCDGFGPYGECSLCTTRTREFECFFNFLGWWQWSLGFHLDVRHPHIDLHVPFGYLRVGWALWDYPPIKARVFYATKNRWPDERIFK